MTESSQVEKTKQSILNLTEYDLTNLPRRDDLGTALSFEKAVGPSREVINLFKRIPTQNLSELPQTELKLLETTADSFFAILEKIESFNSDTLNSSTRDSVVKQIVDQFQPIFTKLFPLISYLTIRTTDFAELETNARAAVQSAKKEAKAATVDVAQLAKEAEAVMDAIRATAAEQGVSQQAIYFKKEADEHQDRAKNWMKLTFAAAIVLLAFAIASLFPHKIPVLSPQSAYEAVQLGLSKFILFGVLGYMLVLCARNFTSHKHNSIVNRHKQNSLVTFTALVEAATGETKQDIILDRASHSIFEIPDSGFSKNSTQSPNLGNTIVRAMPKLTSEE